MTGPLLSVLIPTLSSRHLFLSRLLKVLLPQAEAAPPGTVEVVGLHNDGNWPLMVIRQALLDDARGRWTGFVDDDDLVSGDYVPAILLALEQDPDYVAFRHAYYVDGRLDPKGVRSGITLGGWYETPEFYVRDITHINPARAVLARQAGFRAEVDGWEDRGYDWALRPLLRTQAVIHRVLYHYHARTSGSVQTASLPPHAHLPRPEVTSPVFRWHPWST